MEYKIAQRKMPVCLECGDRIRYGRTDKKFCCDECRLKYNYEQVKASKNYRRRVMAALARNYEILEDLADYYSRYELDEAALTEHERKFLNEGLPIHFIRARKKAQ